MPSLPLVLKNNICTLGNKPDRAGIYLRVMKTHPVPPQVEVLGHSVCSLGMLFWLVGLTVTTAARLRRQQWQ